MTTARYQSLQVGETAMLSRTFAVSDVVQFAQLTGDTNPIHLDAELARRTRFGQPIVHGVLAAGLISAVIGTKLPGPGTIYLSQSLNFEAPVMIGDTITARVTVVRLRRDKPIATLETVCTNQNGRTVLRGKAVVLVEGGD